MIGEYIKQKRKEKKLTQKELADKCGIADSAVRKYESGKVTPKHAMLLRIAAALEIPAEEILEQLTEQTKQTEQDLLQRLEYARSGRAAALILERLNENRLREKMLSDYDTLNDEGKAKARSYIQDLSEQSKYTTLRDLSAYEELLEYNKRQSEEYNTPERKALEEAQRREVIKTLERYALGEYEQAKETR